MANFNYKNTCPIIDNALSNTEADIESMLFSFCSDNEFDINSKAIKEFVDKVYSEIAPYYERVRETNSDIREAAERQITSIQNENKELEDRILELESEIELLNQ